MSERLFTDAYMVQHATGDDPRQIQSVAVHLITLNAVLRLGHNIETASRITSAAVKLGKSRGGYQQLQPPSDWYSTIAEVANGTTEPTVYVGRTFDSWMKRTPATIEEWTSEVLLDLYGS